MSEHSEPSTVWSKMYIKHAPKQSISFTVEEERLLSEFSRNFSTKTLILFYSSAFMVSVLPIWLYWRIHKMELLPALIWLVLVTLGSTYLIAFAYKNIKLFLKHKIIINRHDAVVRKITNKYANDKKIRKKEKDTLARFQKTALADYEATTFTIFYINAIFLVIVILLSSYVLNGFSATTNYIFSVGIASGFVALVSL